MKVSVFSSYGALNSAPVFDAWQQGARRLGWQVTTDDLTADVAVIWSMLWRGRMRGNQDVWRIYRDTGRPVVVLEVGMLQRGRTWKMAINGTTGTASWPPTQDPDRPARLGLRLQPWRQQGHHVLIALQRSDSEQWRDQPRADIWLLDTINQLNRHTDRPIRIRPHPRQNITLPAGATVSRPRSLVNTYDGFDLDRDLANAWAVVNVNSGPGSQAIMAGIPAFVGADSLAAPVANLDLCNIEKPVTPDRDTWLVKISHTEWTTEEFVTGEPQRSLLASN